MKRFISNIIAFLTWVTGRVGNGPQDASELPSTVVEETLPPVLTDRDELVVDPELGEFEAREEVPHVQKYTWCIDRGHGEGTAGKRSPKLPDGRQLIEYEFNRDVTQKIIQKLDAIGVSYFEVVPETSDISLSVRVSRTNNAPSALPKLFVSLHVNANSSGAWDPLNVRGLETWFYGSSTNGKRLASAFQRHLRIRTNFNDRGIKYHDPTYKSFYVLRKTSMPAVLTENGFYTSQTEVLQLLDPAVREEIAQAHVDAILDVERNGVEGIAIYNKIVRIRKS